MGWTWLHTVAYYWLHTTKWIAFTLAALLALSQRTIPESWPSFAENIVLWVRGYAGWPLFVCVVYGTVADRLSGRFKPPQTWDAVHDFMDNLSDHFFKGISDPLHYHRVTLQVEQVDLAVARVEHKKEVLAVVRLAGSGSTLRSHDTA